MTLQDRIGTGATALAMVVVGLGILGWVGRDALRQRASASWPSAPATMTKTGITTVTTDDGSSSSYYPAVEYTFEVAGQRYTGDKIEFLRDDGRDSDDQAEAARIASEWGSKESLVAFYDPADPQKSCLEPGGDLNLRTLGLGLLFGGGTFLVGLLILRGLFRDRRKAE